MEDLCDELYGGGLCGILVCELEREAEGAALPGGVLGPEDDGVPEEHVAFEGRADHPCARVFLQGPQVSHKPSLGGRSHAFFFLVFCFYIFGL